MWFGSIFALNTLDYQNPRADDFYTAEWFQIDSLAYEFSRSIEGFIRKYFLAGEISSNPGGLEGKFWIKCLIPFAGFTLFLQGITNISSYLIKIREN